MCCAGKKGDFLVLLTQKAGREGGGGGVREERGGEKVVAEKVNSAVPAVRQWGAHRRCAPAAGPAAVLEEDELEGPTCQREKGWGGGGNRWRSCWIFPFPHLLDS